MDEFMIGFVVGLTSVAVLLFVLTDNNMRSDAMREAYERGHAVECLGKTGYHWECEQ